MSSSMMFQRSLNNLDRQRCGMVLNVRPDTDAWINQLFEEFEKKTDKKQLELQVVGFIGYTAATLLTKYLWKHREEIRRCIKKRGAHLADLKKRLISDISYIQSDALEMEAEARSSLAPQRAYQFESYY